MSQVNEFWRNGLRYFTIDLGDGEARMCLQQFKFMTETGLNPVHYGIADLPIGKIFYMDFIRVSPQYRNQGHGERLLKACLDWARDTNNIIILDAIPLDQQMDSNRLIRFYLKHGFKQSQYKGNVTHMYYHNRTIKKRVRKQKTPE